MENTIHHSKLSNFWQSIIFCHLSVCLLVVSSLIKIPFYPVSMTLHSAAVFVIALTQRPWQAFASVAMYLFWGTLGFPVFGGLSKPLWMLGATGGYYVAFPIAAFLISYFSRKVSAHFAIFCGQVVIYFLGFLWLSQFYGAHNAFYYGVLFFIPSAIIKNLLTPTIARSINHG